jgi:hypothetical protein
VQRAARLTLLVFVAGGDVAAAAGKKQAPELSQQHVHPSGAFSILVPEGWKVGPAADRPDAWDASQPPLLVRFLHSQGEVGFDSLHVDCMLVRLAGAMDQSPQVKYEYDFLSGTVGERRLLDSAFLVRYDAPIQGHVEWRQRNVTLVGGGESLCIIAYAPQAVWKKDKAARRTLDGIVESVSFPMRASPAPRP